MRADETKGTVSSVIVALTRELHAVTAKKDELQKLVGKPLRLGSPPGT